MDASTVLSRNIASLGIYPAADPLESSSRALDPHIIGEEHYSVAKKVLEILQKYKDLQDIIAILGMDELGEEDKKTVWVNLSQITYIEEIDVEVMPRIDYECRLRKVVREKCLDCVNFQGDPDNLDGHYERLCLDGRCWSYEKRDEDEE